MFVGRYEHSLDRKGRVVLPAPFRASVAERGVVTRLDQCIGLWSEEEFQEVGAKWKAALDAGDISMKAYRKFLNDASPVKLDAAGRITIPRILLDEFEFETQVVVTGLFDRVEIWPREAYEADQGDEAGEELAEAITRLGL